MGHAHHSLVLVYLEEARAAYWREVAGRAGLADIDYIMADIGVRFHGRIFFPGQVHVGVRVTRLGGSSFAMEYDVRDAGGTQLAAGTSTQVMYDYAASRSRPIPPELRARIASFEGISSARP